MISKVRNRAMRVRADHDGIDKAREHARRIRYAFPAPQLHIARASHNGTAAELAHPLFKRKARAGRGFFKNHRQRVAVQRCARVGRAFGQARASGLHRMGVIKNGAELRGRNIGKGDEMGHGDLTLERSVQKVGIANGRGWRKKALNCRARGRRSGYDLSIKIRALPVFRAVLYCGRGSARKYLYGGGRYSFWR